MHDFRGKTAVVTGGGSGIGRGLTLTFASEAMNVVVADVEKDAAERVAQELRTSGARALAVRTDVADMESVRELERVAAAEFGAVHVLCNNAGVWFRRSATEATGNDWRWMIGVNLWGVIHGIQAFLPGMLAHGEPCHIVNTASIAGVLPSTNSVVYSTTKFAVAGLTETLAEELKGMNVAVSVLCPAGVATRIQEAERNRPAEFASPEPPRSPQVPNRGARDFSAALEPVEVGRLVLHVFTDLRIKPHIEARHMRMLAEFDRLAEYQESESQL